ncbi:unnamed protein product, partial [marine sediment metagenome]
MKKPVKKGLRCRPKDFYALGSRDSIASLFALIRSEIRQLEMVAGNRTAAIEKVLKEMAEKYKEAWKDENPHIEWFLSHNKFVEEN